MCIVFNCPDSLEMFILPKVIHTGFLGSCFSEGTPDQSVQIRRLSWDFCRTNLTARLGLIPCWFLHSGKWGHRSPGSDTKCFGPPFCVPRVLLNFSLLSDFMHRGSCAFSQVAHFVPLFFSFFSVKLDPVFLTVPVERPNVVLLMHWD